MFSILLFCFIGSAFALPPTQQIEQRSSDLLEEQWTRPETPEAGYLGLSSGASLVVPRISTKFSCLGRGYGYYADVDNNCQIYHICQPSKSAKGELIIYQYTQFCPNLTRFDQRQHSCLQLTDSNLLLCEQSSQYYPLTESRFREVPVVVEQREVNPLQTEQRLEQIPVEQRHEALESVLTTPVRGSEVLTQTRIDTPIVPTRSVGRTESVQIVPQVQPIVPLRRVPFGPTVQRSVAPQVDLVRPVVPQVNSVQQVVPQVVERVPQVVRSQPVVSQPNLAEPIVPLRSTPLSKTSPQLLSSQSGLVRPIVQRSDLVEPIVQQREVELTEPVVPEVVSGPRLRIGFLPGVLSVAGIPVNVLQQLGLIQPNADTQPIRDEGVSSQSTVSQSVVSSRRAQVLQPEVRQFEIPLRSVQSEQIVPQSNVVLSLVPQPVVNQPIVPLRISRLVENAQVKGNQAVVSRHNIPLSQTVVPLPQVVPQVHRTQSVLTRHTQPLVDIQLPRVQVRPVVPQNPVSQPVVSSFTSDIGVTIPRTNVLRDGLKSRSVDSPVVSNLVRNVEPVVVRPAQNLNFE